MFLCAVVWRRVWGQLLSLSYVLLLFNGSTREGQRTLRSVPGTRNSSALVKEEAEALG